MSHIEDLIAEYYDWQGYLVKRKIVVGQHLLGSEDMVLDLIAFNPKSGHMIHIEPSIDSDSWNTHIEHFVKKFHLAKELIFSEVFTWLDPKVEIEQVSVLVTHPKGREKLGDAKLESVDELMAEIRRKVTEQGPVVKNPIPEHYPLLRTLQLSHNGYYEAL
ncbi:hypothetical protein P886_1213 [Alteromonadaceae bacterium 2753L.S.0a.02]|nr:hypothetical protein P886_1213 [Alteromonadaceae bacterium 2753L.S.0a.02]